MSSSEEDNYGQLLGKKYLANVKKCKDKTNDKSKLKNELRNLANSLIEKEIGKPETDDKSYFIVFDDDNQANRSEVYYCRNAAEAKLLDILNSGYGDMENLNAEEISIQTIDTITQKYLKRLNK